MYSNILQTAKVLRTPKLNHACISQARQIQHLYDHAPLALWASTFIAIFVFILLWNQIPTTILIGWSILLAIVLLARLVLAKRYHTLSSTNQVSYDQYYKGYLVGICISGILWGLLTFIVAQNAGTTAIQFTVLLIAGLCAGVAVSVSASMIAFLCFVVPAVLPGSIYLFFMNSPSKFCVGACFLTFFLFLLLLEKNINNSILDSLSLENVNRTLLKSLDIVMKHIDHAVIIIDPVTRKIVDVNDYACEFFGHDASKLVMADYSSIVPNGDSELKLMLDRAMNEGKTHSCCQKYITTLGLSDDIDTTLSIIPTESGMFVLCVLKEMDTLSDESRLARNEEKNQQLINEFQLLNDIQQKDRKKIANSLYMSVNAELKNIVSELYSLSKEGSNYSDDTYKHLDNILSEVRTIEDIIRIKAQRLVKAFYIVK